MSLAINTHKIRRVLLADGWHNVLEQSFTIDAYEFAEDGQTVHSGGQSSVCASGFAFKTETGVWSGPLTSVLAVETK
jgi:hypothetical protein